MLRLPQRHPLPLAFAALALLALPAAATTIVPMRDSALVDGARLVVVAETVDVLPVVDERPATDYLMRIERVLKGEVAAGSLVVRVPGGFTPDGRELRLYGAPRFQAGERALLFLGPERDGSYRILQFLQGAFHRARRAASSSSDTCSTSRRLATSSSIVSPVCTSASGPPTAASGAVCSTTVP